MNKYLAKLNYLHTKINTEVLEKYAQKNHVPIIEYDSLTVLLTIIKICKIHKILEIGTAIGYSAIHMASCKTVSKIDTIERNKSMYEEAVKNIELYKMQDKVKPHFADALDIELENLDHDYDLLFIDAAKVQSEKFFKRFLPLLKEESIIITDNILFHGCVENRENLSKNVSKMVEKIDQYNDFLANLENFETIFINIGDGLAITIRNK